MPLRLPRTRYMGVQTLGRKSVSAELAGGRAFGAAIEQLGASVEDYVEKQAKHEEVLAALKVSEAEVAFEKEFGGRDFFKPDEVPEDIKVNRSQGRVPSHQVYAQMYQGHMKKAIDAASPMITDNKRRGAWSARIGKTLNGKYVTKHVAGIKAQEEQQDKEIVAEIKTAQQAGNYAVAGALVDASALPDWRKTDLRRELREQAEYQGIVTGLRTANTAAEIDMLEEKLLRSGSPLKPSQQNTLAGQLESRRNRMTRDIEARRKAETTRVSAERANSLVIDMYDRDKPFSWADVTTMIEGMQGPDAARVVRLNKAMHMAPPVSDRGMKTELGSAIRQLSIVEKDDTDAVRTAMAQQVRDAIDEALIQKLITAEDHRKFQEDVGKAREAPITMNPDIERVEDSIYRGIVGASKGMLSSIKMNTEEAIALDDALADFYDAMRQPGPNANQWWEDNAARYMGRASVKASMKASQTFIQGLGADVWAQGDPTKTWNNIVRPEIWETLSGRQKTRMIRWHERAEAGVGASGKAVETK